MPRENRHRKKEKQRRQFTVTKSKALLAFVLSLLFSLLLSPAFDKVARLLSYRYSETGKMFEPSGFGSLAPEASKAVDEETSSDTLNRLKRIAEREKLEKSQEPHSR